ncbi:hypothetical protein CSV72_14580 [Sporosarcina sp. P20a]|uniref:hypothetical protein n=1 Tax=Sporosarcina sp. P20a TaxID=2048256 RepID=UPI000C1655C4|nr:hypothetical protein [Sporosarcina sp. P20a]PIC85250.1 hypothetical protein CSV72_14580 [Sporosarcina sp. P20a]
MANNLTTDGLLLAFTLYEEEEINNLQLVYNLTSEYHTIQFDCYCISCERNSTFKKETKLPPPISTRNRTSLPPMGNTETPEKRMHRVIQGNHALHFQCQRNNKHLYSFYFKIFDSKIMKIGQYPSIADLQIHKIQKYRSLLKDDYKDFSKAIGLYSHGIGAGSYVYLRRIFENLINNQKVIALKENSSLKSEVFSQKRMDEKILYIKNFLPEILVKNRTIYGILSKGIHELSEEDCLSMFPSLELGIEIILDWKLAEKEKQEKEKRLSKFVSETANKFK